MQGFIGVCVYVVPANGERMLPSRTVKVPRTSVFIFIFQLLSFCRFSSDPSPWKNVAQIFSYSHCLAFEFLSRMHYGCAYSTTLPGSDSLYFICNSLPIRLSICKIFPALHFFPNQKWTQRWFVSHHWLNQLFLFHSLMWKKSFGTHSSFGRSTAG